MNYVELYYGKEVLDWYDSAMKLPNAISLRPSASFSARCGIDDVRSSIFRLDICNTIV